MIGGSEDNVMSSGGGKDWLYGGSGSDTLSGGGGADNIFGEAGQDFLYGQDGDDNISGGDNNDTIYGDGGPLDIFGLSVGNDTIHGDAGDDTLDGGLGDDHLYGDIGNDTLYGGKGNDYLEGGAGADSLYGNEGDDDISADTNDNLIDGGSGYDAIDFSKSTTAITWSEVDSSVRNIEKIVGSELNDTLVVDNSDPLGYLSFDGVDVDGGAGNDLIRGDDAPNMLWGGSGNDTIEGKAGSDTIEGGDGNDTLIGGDDSPQWAPDNDTISGGAGNDTLRGGAGADTLSGDSGSNYIYGGAGNDTISSTGAADVVSGDGDNDLIKASGVAAEIHFKAGDGNDLVETGDGAYQLVLDGLSADDITFIAGGTDIYSTYYLTDINVLSIKINSTGDTITFSKSALHGNMFNGIRARDGVTLVDYAGVNSDTLHNSPVNSIKFADGSVWSTSSIWDYILDYKNHSNVAFSVLQPIHNGYYGQIPADRQVGFGSMMADFTSMQSQSSTTQGTLSTISKDPISYIDNLNATYFQRDPLPYPAGEVIVGTSYDEGFEDGYGNDDLTGGQGNDGYSLSFGDDTIRWNIGDGNDVAYGARIYGGNDTLVLGAGIAPTDLQFAVTPDGNGLVISFANTAGSVTLANELDAFVDRGAFSIAFHGGATWTHDQLLAAANSAITAAHQTIVGTSGADSWYLPQTNFTVQGLAGDDVLSVGGDGRATIVFAKGDGHDTLSDYSASDYRADTLSLTDILPDEITLTRGGDALIISVTATGDTFTAENQFIGELPDASLGVSQVVFANGVTWDRDRIQSELGAIRGDAGNNVLTGSSANDILVGGRGSDTLIGGGGNDIYRYASGDGSDIIDDYGDGSVGVGGTDVIQFASGILPGNVTVAEGNSGADLVLTIAGSGTLTLKNTIAFPDRRIEQVTFADNTVWSHADLLARATMPTAGNDIFYGDENGQALQGGAGNDTLVARAGDDTLIGGIGNDSLNGGTGNDVLQGGADDDTYQFGRGDGQDQILDYVQQPGGSGGADTIVLAAGIAPGDIIVTEENSGADLKLTIAGTTDSITLQTVITSPAARIEQVKFADNTVWSYADLLAKATAPSSAVQTLYGDENAQTIDGGAGNDTIIAREGDDILIGGLGVDILSGGAGNDTYRYTRGDGRDHIEEVINGASGGGFDTIEFAAGIAPTDVIVTESSRVVGGPKTDFLLSITGTSGFVELQNTIIGGDSRIEQVRFADGTIWYEADLLARATVPTDGDDVFYGDEAGQTLIGGVGNDTLNGGGGDDTLVGGAGNDDLTGGAGNDALLGRVGTADVAHFAGAQSTYQLSTVNGVVTITDTAPTVDGDDGTDTLVGVEILAFGDGTTMSIVSPIVLALDGNAPTFTPTANSNASIDLNGDGVADKASWIGSGDAFLFLDRNHDGSMSGVGEMRFIDDKPDAGSDLEGLAAFDTNGDGALSAGDAGFQDFGLWQDANGNGQVDTGETHSLADAGIASVNLSRTPTQSQWAWGSSIVLNSGTFTRADGSTGALADVALAFEAGSPSTHLASGPVSIGGSSDQRAQVYARQLIDAIASFEPETPGFLDIANAGPTGNGHIVGLVGRPTWSELRSS